MANVAPSSAISRMPSYHCTGCATAWGEIVEDRLGGIHRTAPRVGQVARRRAVPGQAGEVRREATRGVRLQGAVRRTATSSRS
jgi:hypothetical protein